MERGRILIIGDNKETTYEIRSLLDNQRFELEIALSSEVGKLVLDSRQMNLIMVDSAMIQKEDVEFLKFLQKRALDTPVAILGDDAQSVPRDVEITGEVQCFGKPYRIDDVLSFIRRL